MYPYKKYDIQKILKYDSSPNCRMEVWLQMNNTLLINRYWKHYYTLKVTTQTKVIEDAIAHYAVMYIHRRNLLLLCIECLQFLERGHLRSAGLLILVQCKHFMTHTRVMLSKPFSGLFSASKKQARTEGTNTI